MTSYYCKHVSLLVAAAAFLILAVSGSAETAIGEKPDQAEILVEAAPQWDVGDTRKYHADKPLDTVVTQNLGPLQITMRLENVETTSSSTVSGRETIDGIDCYTLKITGEQKITGRYDTAPSQDEALRGDILQQSSFEGVEYRRVSDLAFVKTTMKASGTIEIGGILQAIPVPFQSDSITTADPPVKQFKFPLLKGDTWHISSVVTTTSTGTSSDTVVITFNYDSKAVGKGVATVDGGKTFDCAVIHQEGTQTTQSQNAGVTIAPINGNLYFSPLVGNVVIDEAEGQELIEYAPAEQTQHVEPPATQAPVSGDQT